MSCLFNSLSTFKNITEDDNSVVIRQKICDFLLTNPILFDNIDAKTAIEWESNISLESYVSRMRNPSTWGGSIEIKCFCEIYKCNVEVYIIRDYSSSTSSLTMLSKNITFQCNSETSIKETLLAKITWNGGHYEPL